MSELFGSVSARHGSATGCRKPRWVRRIKVSRNAMNKIIGERPPIPALPAPRRHCEGSVGEWGLSAGLERSGGQYAGARATSPGLKTRPRQLVADGKRSKGTVYHVPSLLQRKTRQCNQSHRLPLRLERAAPPSCHMRRVQDP